MARRDFEAEKMLYMTGGGRTEESSSSFAWFWFGLKVVGPVLLGIAILWGLMS